MPEFIVPTDPVKLASPYAEELVVAGKLDSFDVSDYEKLTITKLEELATMGNLLDRQYFVETRRAITLPADVEDQHEISTTHFNELSFVGEFKTFATVRLRIGLGHSGMQALCLMFDNVTMLPYMDRMYRDELMYTPVLAVATIDHMAA